MEFLISILGLQIGLLQFLQLVTTAAIIAIYTVSVSLRDQKAYDLGERHSCILISFLIKYHPKINQLSEIIKISKYSYSRLLVSEFEAFQESGELPVQRKERVSTLLFRHLFWAAISPIGAFLFFIMTIRDEMQHKNQRVIHTEERKGIVSKLMINLFVNLVFLFITLQFILPNFFLWGIAISILMGFGIVFSILNVSLFILWQQSWKDYWQNKHLEVMALAEREANHDLFNRAMIFKDYIESQPDIPIPGNLTLYAVVYSGIQFLLLWIFSVI